MSYVAQIANITPKGIKGEGWALQRISHIPHNAFPNDTFFYQQEIGMRSINLLQIISKTAMIRTAKITCSWKAVWVNLQKARNEKGPMSNLAIPENQPGKDNPWWSDPAFADNLFEADKTVPNGTWSTILKSTSKKKGSAQAATTKCFKNTLLTKNLAQIIAPSASLMPPKPTKEEPSSMTTSKDP